MGASVDEQTSAPITRVTRRVDALDGLRGCLAQVVVLGHALPLLFPAIDGDGPRRFGIDHLVDRSPLAVLIAGDFAVRVFFVHSGFVLALKYFRSGDRRCPTAMLVRRPLRLGLPVAAAGLVAWLLVVAAPMRPRRLAAVTGGPVPGLFPTSPDVGDVLLDVVGRTTLTGHHELPGPWWTMPVELWCSLALLGGLIAWAALGRRGRQILFAGWVVSLGAAVALSTDAPPLYFQDLGGALRLLGLQSSAFVLGAALAAVWARDDELIGRWVGRIPLGVAVVGLGGTVLGVFPRVVEPLTLGSDGLLQLVLIAAAGFVLVAVLASEWLQRLFETPFVAWLGRISFCVYLVHMAVQRTVMAEVLIWLRTDLDLPYLAAAGLVLVGHLALVLGLAHLLAITVDRAAMTWGKDAVYRRLGLARPPAG